MTITWIGHSCFKIESNGYSIVLDPYDKGTVPGLGDVDETADRVICSHSHFDHNGVGRVKVVESGGKPFEVTTIHTFHDDVKGSQRGKNDINIIDDGTVKVAHFGDLGCGLTEGELSLLKGIDVALMPVGGCYTVDGDTAAEILKEVMPGIIIPMHYRDGFGFDVISTVDDFTRHYEKVCHTGTCSLEIDDIADLKDEVYVLRPKMSLQ